MEPIFIMDTFTTSQYSKVFRTTTQSQSMFILCFVVLCSANYTAASSLMETFEDRQDIPAFECGTSGWSVRHTDSGSHAFSACASECSHNLTITRQRYSNLISTTLVFYYALLNVQGGSDAQISAPTLNLYCQECSIVRVWSSSFSFHSNGEWKLATVTLKARPFVFNLIFEAMIESEGQAIGLDNVYIQSSKMTNDKGPALPKPINLPSDCTDNDPIGGTMAGNANTSRAEQQSEVQWPLREGFPTSTEMSHYGTTLEPPNAESGHTFGLLDNETTLLIAQILAIASVIVCVTTVSIHCLVWRKQRRLQRARSAVPMRRKVSGADPHDSMLLEMNLIPSDEPDQPCSNSLNEPHKTRFLQQLKDMDIGTHQDGRRATVSCTTSRAHIAAVQYDSDDESDEDKERPHPRTKSLPCRPPVNVYESIDEVSKYQPLTFGKRPAPKPPCVPGGRRLHVRSRGVQNLAAVKKYRPSSVQYEEIGNRSNGMLDVEPRDRSRSASQYDYVKKKSSSQSPRKNGWRYSQAQRPKSRAPPPPMANRLYDEPVRKAGQVPKVESAPSLLLHSAEPSGGEGALIDDENIVGHSYDSPSTSAQNTSVRPGTESQYFTLEPPVVGKNNNSDDSDDERDSERDISRFEDAEETGTGAAQNGVVRVPGRPLSVSAPIDIPTSPTPIFECELQSSRL